MANPNKTPEVVEVLASNKEKLLKYLGDFHTEKGADSAPSCLLHMPRKAPMVALTPVWHGLHSMRHGQPALKLPCMVHACMGWPGAEGGLGVCVRERR